jgi:hypothetical protein
MNIKDHSFSQILTKFVLPRFFSNLVQQSHIYRLTQRARLQRNAVFLALQAVRQHFQGTIRDALQQLF